MTEHFRIYTNSDVTGVELGGSLKNVIAIASGAADALGFGTNAKAALLTRGLAEIVRLGLAMGAKKETFYGLSGFDSAYLDERAQTFESLGGAYRMDRTELARREAKVASFCAKFDSKSAEFVSCYLNVLRDPWLN